MVRTENERLLETFKKVPFIKRAKIVGFVTACAVY